MIEGTVSAARQSAYLNVVAVLHWLGTARAQHDPPLCSPMGGTASTADWYLTQGGGKRTIMSNVMNNVIMIMAEALKAVQ